MPNNPRIDQGIAPIVLMPQILLEPTTKEVVADTALGCVWVNRTLSQVSKTEVEEINPGDINNDVSSVEPPYSVLIVIVATSPPCGLNTSQQFANKRQSTPPGLAG